MTALPVRAGVHGDVVRRLGLGILEGSWAPGGPSAERGRAVRALPRQPDRLARGRPLSRRQGPDRGAAAARHGRAQPRELEPARSGAARLAARLGHLRSRPGPLAARGAPRDRARRRGTRRRACDFRRPRPDRGGAAGHDPQPARRSRRLLQGRRRLPPGDPGAPATMSSSASSPAPSAPHWRRPSASRPSSRAATSARSRRIATCWRRSACATGTPPRRACGS